VGDTAILKSLTNEEYTVSESELRDWMSDISKDLKHAIAQQAMHSQESAVYRASNDARVKNLEDHLERRSAFKSGLTMSGIGAFFGLLGAWLARKMGVGIILACVLLVGCALTPEETRTIAAEVRSETHEDGTPLTPAEIETRIKEKGAEKKKNKGWGIALTLLQVAIMVGSSLTKKAVL